MRIATHQSLPLHDRTAAQGLVHVARKMPKNAHAHFILGKILYSDYSCTKGCFFTPCTSDPGLRFNFSKR
ncbi:hypothetical protein RIF29_18801 [Crotalaria pallida]|uniref:Uncharacterized protein n=1 Tax=Crotalaria pallida TaxID=3830 RepID=A0AAN9EYD7_CROPI